MDQRGHRPVVRKVGDRSLGLKSGNLIKYTLLQSYLSKMFFLAFARALETNFIRETLIPTAAAHLLSQHGSCLSPVLPASVWGGPKSCQTLSLSSSSFTSLSFYCFASSAQYSSAPTQDRPLEFVYIFIHRCFLNCPQFPPGGFVSVDQLVLLVFSIFSSDVGFLVLPNAKVL